MTFIEGYTITTYDGEDRPSVEIFLVDNEYLVDNLDTGKRDTVGDLEAAHELAKAMRYRNQYSYYSDRLNHVR